MLSCKKCGKKYTVVRYKQRVYFKWYKPNVYYRLFKYLFNPYIYYEWCKPCQINNLKGNFTNWTSGNEKIDDFIQEMQLKIDHPYNIIFEWIPYNQFSDIEEIGI